MADKLTEEQKAAEKAAGVERTDPPKKPVGKPFTQDDPVPPPPPPPPPPGGSGGHDQGGG